MLGVLFEDVLKYNKVGFTALTEKVNTIPAPSINKLEKVQRLWKIKFDEEDAILKKSLEEQNGLIASLYKKLDETSADLEKAKKVYNEANEEKLNIESNAKADSIVLDVSAARSAKSSGANSKGFEQSSEKSLIESAKAVAVAKNKAQAALKEVDTLRDKNDTLKLQLNTISGIAKQLQIAHTKKVAGFQYQKELDMEEAYNDLKSVSAPNLQSLVSDDYTGTKARIFYDIVSLATRVERIVKNNAISAVQDALNEIRELGDDRFDLEKYYRLVDIHKRTMDRINNPSVSLSDNLGSLIGYINIKPVEIAVAKLMAEVLFDKVCNNGICNKKDTQYYVGIIPNEKDFTIPKIIIRHIHLH